MAELSETRVAAVATSDYLEETYPIVSGMSLSINHGLRGVPKQVWLSTRCITAELGYAVGDEVSYPGTSPSTGESVSVGFNKTKILVNLSALLFVSDPSNSNTSTIITAANWVLVVRATI